MLVPSSRSSSWRCSVGSGSAASPSDQLTRTHRMTLDEAKLILNLKQDLSAAGLGTGAATASGEGKSVLDQVVKPWSRTTTISSRPTRRHQRLR